MRIAAIAFILFALVASACATEGDTARFDWYSQRYFDNAPEAASFVSQLPFEARARADFFSEFHEGAPSTVAFRVFVDRGALVAPWFPKDFRWESSARRFGNLPEAVQFANDRQIFAKYVAVWDHWSKSTTIAVFYVSPALPTPGPSIRYVIVDKEFSSAKEAADYANDNLPAETARWVQFVPERFTNQIKTHWRVVYLLRGPREERKIVWKAAETSVFTGSPGSNGYPPDRQSVPSVIGESAALFGIRLASIYNEGGLESSLVLFRGELSQEEGGGSVANAGSFSVPVRILVKGDLLREMREEQILDIVDTSAESLKLQTSGRVVLMVERKVSKLPSDWAVSDVDFLVRNFAASRGVMSVIFTDKPIRLDAHPGPGDPEASFGYAGKGWVVVWLYPPTAEIFTPEATLLHEFGHEFGAPHTDDASSVMCAPLIASLASRHCPKNSLIFGDGSLDSVLRGIRAAKKNGFGTIY